jgi:hypothetical protein
MAKCCGARSCFCTVTAGPGVTVDGNGSPTNPYVVSSDAAATPTPLGVTDTPTVDLTLTGTGTAGDPYDVHADVILDPTPPGGGSNLLQAGPEGLFVECADVRTCFSAGDGAGYDPATGEITARLSTDPGNAAVFGTDGGLYAPVGGSAAVQTACGLTGDGTAGTPLAAEVAAWPYPCDVDANAGRVFCDNTGQLRSEPRGSITFMQDQQTLDAADLVVPTPEDTEVATHVLNVPNPDPCRSAFVIMEAEVDADFNLPPGAGAALGISTDEMSYLGNSGATPILDTHVQSTKVVNGGTIAPGGTLTYTLSIRMGRGSAGATYNRVQSFLRAFVVVL